MKKDLKIKAAALLFFAALTIFELWPLPLHLNDSLREQADSLLNTWILAHVSQQLLSNPLHLFETNIFFPNPQTLSFSEHMLPLAIISMPVYYLSKNPVLVYNLILFLCYVLNGYAMFLLVRYLTRNNLSGLLAGIVFAFSTYQIQHLTHLQLLSSWLVPLSFLYLHKFFEAHKLKDSILFATFFTLQALACIYYGLFMTSLFVVWLPLLCLLDLKNINLSFAWKLILPLPLAAAVLFLFSLPYISLIKNFDFQRELTPGADPINYLAVFDQNIFLGNRLSPLGGNEFFLFPGIAALFFAALFLFFKRRLFKNVPKLARMIFLAFILACLVSAAVIFLTKGFSLNLGFLSLSAHNLSKTVYFALLGVFCYILISFFFFAFKRPERQAEDSHVFLYLILLLWAFFLSLGGNFTFLGYSSVSLPLPFKWFYDHAFGFKGIRVPSRYALFVLFSIAIFAGYGLRLLQNEIKNKNIKAFLLAGLFLFINLEYLTIPQPRIALPVKKDIPPTYLWLKEQPGNFAVIELPFHPFIGDDALYMYFSLFHNKKMVNGYSGYIPPATSYIRQVFLGFPSASSLDVLNALKIKYVILHLKMWNEEKGLKVQQKIEEKFSHNLKLIKTFQYGFSRPNDFEDELGYDFVYEVIPLEKQKNNLPVPVELPPSDWKVRANLHEEFLPYLKDGNLETCWTTEQPKKTGDLLLIEFIMPERIRQVSLFYGKYRSDFAFDLEIETSQDGMIWEGRELAFSPGEFAKILIEHPKDLRQDIHLDEKEISFLRITQVGKGSEWYWSVAELKVYKRP